MSNCELIELEDLTFVDGIELAPPPLPPTVTATPRTPRQSRVTELPILGAVVRLVGDSVRLEEPVWNIGKTARGHDFQTCPQVYLSWCDLCGEFIWGLYTQGLRCIKCKYTCHYRCQPLIQLDCYPSCSAFPQPVDVSEDTVETDTNVDEHIECRKKQLTASEIQRKVKEYNAQIHNNHFMVLNRDGSYTGFIKVQFKLSRPVSLPQASSNQSCSLTQDGSWQGSSGSTHRTSFYLPKDAAKYLHISSSTQAQEVIKALLNKFTVMDNPAKFALFERVERQNQIYLRKLGDDEHPLQLRLCAGPSEKALSLVLRENETGEVNWDAFTLPELQNFLRILQREEEEHVRQIVQRYALARERMKDALTNISA